MGWGGVSIGAMIWPTSVEYTPRSAKFLRTSRAWFTQNTGQHSPPGLLTFGVGTAYGARGWGDLEIVGGQ